MIVRACWTNQRIVKGQIPFNGGCEHQRAFHPDEERNFKCSSVSILYPKKQTMLQTDACIKSLGACFLQEEKPVYFASKALKDAQRGYMAIEIKLLAVAWAMEKFHQILYASHFILGTEQKPLEAILSKSFEPSNPSITADTDQNFCLPLYSKIYTWCYKPACRIFVKIKLSKKIASSYQCYTFIRLPVNIMQEVTVWMILEM